MPSHLTPSEAHPAAQPGPRRSRTRSLWSTATSGVGAVLGIVPHLLHHIGPLVGTAVVAGSGGTALFAVLGLLASLPMLRRLHRRTGSLWAPAIALVLFIGAFAVSTFVVGPLISDIGSAPAGEDVHESHHTSGGES
ncbi:hypothetical protein MHY85_02035 [Cellulomonas sp. ACRRI]|uniref:hypothetical protein n=1 Tax=Cellulomonas sp. ACRRI TaxID=2918188 RepID=UPI001EF325EA|nr:hypothetical protein [Cellulomonas sp. ACRRI]MCG7284751.1 hypothetical protein [Cellulomonas sp. ACRRI]